MPAPVPLPLTWRVHVTVHCPSCGQDWNFIPEQNGRYKRDSYCPNPACPQYGTLYTIDLGLDGVQVVGVRPKQ